MFFSDFISTVGGALFFCSIPAKTYFAVAGSGVPVTSSMKLEFAIKNTLLNFNLPQGSRVARTFINVENTTCVSTVKGVVDELITLDETGSENGVPLEVGFAFANTFFDLDAC